MGAGCAVEWLLGLAQGRVMGIARPAVLAEQPLLWPHAACPWQRERQEEIRHRASPRLGLVLRRNGDLPGQWRSGDLQRSEVARARDWWEARMVQS